LIKLLESGGRLIRKQYQLGRGKRIADEASSLPASEWISKYGPRLLRPTKELLRDMSACNCGIGGCAHKNCYPTKDSEAELVVHEVNGLVVGTELEIKHGHWSHGEL